MSLFKNEEIVMAFATVDKSGLECLFNEKPIRRKDFWYPSVIGQTYTLNDWGDEECENLYDDWINLPKGSIKKLIGRELSWDDEPVELH